MVGRWLLLLLEKAGDELRQDSPFLYNEDIYEDSVYNNESDIMVSVDSEGKCGAVIWFEVTNVVNFKQRDNHLGSRLQAATNKESKAISGKLDAEPDDQKWERERHRVWPLVVLIFVCFSSKEK